MWVRSKRDGGVQFFPDDWEYTAYHMASGLFEEIPDPTVSAPDGPEATLALGVATPAPASGPSRKIPARSPAKPARAKRR